MSQTNRPSTSTAATPATSNEARAVATLTAEQERLLLKIAQFIWLAFGILESLIGLRFLLKLIAANPSNDFAQWIYAATQPFLAPFVGLTPTLSASGIVVETYALIALVVYALLGLLVVRLLRLVFSRF